MKSIAVFASGTGSNFLEINRQINNGFIDAKLALLVSDKPHSKVVSSAKELGIEVFTFNPKDYTNKTEFESIIKSELEKRGVDLIVLAGYMRLIANTLLDPFHKRIINIHPSLLPLYKGKDAIGQALHDKASSTGVTVHYVDAGMDTGEIIAQESLEILPNEKRETLEPRVHEIEHKLYSKVIKQLVEEL